MFCNLTLNRGLSSKEILRYAVPRGMFKYLFRRNEAGGNPYHYFYAFSVVSPSNWYAFVKTRGCVKAVVIFTHHLWHAEAMPEIVERNVVVMLVNLVQPLAKSHRWNVKFLQEAQLHEHSLKQMQHFVVFEVVRVERRQPQGHLDVLRKCGVANLQELLFNVAVLWETGFALRRRKRSIW